MRSTADLKTSSRVLNILNDQHLQEAPSDHAVPSSSSSTTFLGGDRDVAFGLSVFWSPEQNMEERLPDSISTIDASRRPTRRQCQQCLSQISQDDLRKNLSKNINERQRTGTPILPEQHEPRTKKDKERSKPRLEYIEKAGVSKSSKPKKTRQGVNYTNTVLLDSRYQQESPSQSSLSLGPAERISLRSTEGESQHICSTDTIGVGLPSTSDSQAAIVPQKISLPTPPHFDTGSDHIGRSIGVESNKPDGDPSYRFLLVPRRPPENTVPSTARSHFLPEPYSIQGTTPPARKRPVLNLVWRDMGNGISRAYPRHELPPLSSEPPATLPTLIEELEYFVESDGHTTVAQGYSNEDTDVEDAIEDEDWLVFDEHELRILSEPRNDHREPVNVFLSDSKTDTNTTFPALISRIESVSPYCFIPAPQITTTRPNCTPEVENVESTLHARTHANHYPDDEVTNNVQPTRLTPHRVDAPSGGPPQFLKIDQYNPNTSSGFSDNESETEHSRPPRAEKIVYGATTHAHKKRKRKRSHRHKKQRKFAATTTSTCLDTHNFARVAVLRAAERLTGLLDRKRF